MLVGTQCAFGPIVIGERDGGIDGIVIEERNAAHVFGCIACGLKLVVGGFERSG